MTDDDFDRTLVGLRRSSALFTIAASAVILLVLLSSIYTNVRVVQITDRLQTQQDRADRREHLRDIKDCASRNTIRTANVTFWGALVAQGANMAQATLVDPTATADEKRRARQTLESLPAFSKQVSESFAAETCAPH